MIWLLYSLAFSQVKNLPINDQNLSFEYVSSDGEISLSCQHKRIRDLPDWEVNCSQGSKITKRFVAHVVVSKLNRPQAPATSYDILYWITDRNQYSPRFSSSSMTFNMVEKSTLQSMRLYQGVENDYAQVILNLKL